MKTITFIDTEVSLENKRIVDIGAIISTGEELHDVSIRSFETFISGTDYLCGHNIIHYDLNFLRKSITKGDYLVDGITAIDTLYLSALLFPKRPYHKLVKDDKLHTEDLNNPLNDAKKAMNLFYDEIEAFRKLPFRLKRIFYTLLKDQIEFRAFFSYLNFNEYVLKIEDEIKSVYNHQICQNANVKMMIEKHPVELCYCLALIYADDDYSITPSWILKQFSNVDYLIQKLRGC